MYVFARSLRLLGMETNALVHVLSYVWECSNRSCFFDWALGWRDMVLLWVSCARRYELFNNKGDLQIQAMWGKSKDRSSISRVLQVESPLKLAGSFLSTFEKMTFLKEKKSSRIFCRRRRCRRSCCRRRRLRRRRRQKNAKKNSFFFNKIKTKFDKKNWTAN